jgi:hypothetical protein
MTTPFTASVNPARLQVDYPEQHNRVTTLFRVVLVIPIAIVLGVLTAGATKTVYDQGGNVVSTTSGGIAAGLFTATLLMILFRQRFVAVVIAWFTILITGRYPRGLFDFVVGVARWWLRVQAYAFLLVTDRYPPLSLT